MPPENSAPQFGQPSLPPLPSVQASTESTGGVATPVASVPSAPITPAPGAAEIPNQAASVIAEAKRIMEQYAGKPYQQNMALQQLKAGYISQRFHIEPKRTQN